MLYSVSNTKNSMRIIIENPPYLPREAIPGEQHILPVYRHPLQRAFRQTVLYKEKKAVTERKFCSPGIAERLAIFLCTL